MEIVIRRTALATTSTFVVRRIHYYYNKVTSLDCLHAFSIASKILGDIPYKLFALSESFRFFLHAIHAFVCKHSTRAHLMQTIIMRLDANSMRRHGKLT